MCFFLLPAVDCGPLTSPLAGLVSHTNGTTFGSMATYSCNNGYNLIGNVSRTCGAEGEWTGSEPMCESMFSR